MAKRVLEPQRAIISLCLCAFWLDNIIWCTIGEKLPVEEAILDLRDIQDLMFFKNLD